LGSSYKTVCHLDAASATVTRPTAIFFAKRISARRMRELLDCLISQSTSSGGILYAQSVPHPRGRRAQKFAEIGAGK
jgi:hypothetical protein